MDDNKILCPLVDDVIEDIDCIENRDVINEMIVEEALPDKYKKKVTGKKYARIVNGTIIRYHPFERVSGIFIPIFRKGGS